MQRKVDNNFYDAKFDLKWDLYRMEDSLLFDLSYAMTIRKGPG